MQFIILRGSHDANLCLVVNGTVLAVVELERIFGVRYFRVSPAIYEPWHTPSQQTDEVWATSLLQLHLSLDVLFSSALPAFEPSRPQTTSLVTIAVPDGEAVPADLADLESEFVKKPLSKYLAPLIGELPIVVCEHHVAEHHASHATLGVHSSPFTAAFVLSFDGQGSDGSTEIFFTREIVTAFDILECKIIEGLG